MSLDLPEPPGYPSGPEEPTGPGGPGPESPPADGSTNGPDGPDGPGAASGRLAHLIALLIVVATLAAALVGYLLTSASRSSDAAAANAQHLGIDAMGGLLRAQQQAQAQYETFVTAQEELRQAANALQEDIFASGSEDTRLRLANKRWTNLAKETQDKTIIKPDGPDGPHKDPFFPDRFFTQATQNAVRLSALQDAANAENSAWSSRVASYTAMLTMLAVALYLFGFALNVRPQIRRLFTGVGVALLAVSIIWAASVSASPPRRAPDRAADEFAAGVVALRTATDRAGYADAVQHLNKAIELRPTFARAYFERAGAIFDASSPQSSLFRSITTPQALAESIVDLERARDLGLVDYTVLGDLGFDEYLRALSQKDNGLMGQSIDDTRSAISLAPDQSFLYYNLGLALLARGDLNGSRQAYTDAALWTIYSDPAKKTLRKSTGLEEDILAGGLTDLQNLVDARPDLASDVLATKEFLVGSVSRGNGTLGAQRSGVTVTGGKVTMFPAEVQVSNLTVTGLGDSNHVSLQWYYEDPTHLGWAVLPGVSGGSLSADRDGTYFDLESFLASDNKCIPDGQYRVEVYVDGALAAHLQGTANFGDLTPAIDRDINVSLCHPPTWQQAQNVTDLPGVINGFVSPDSTEGVYIFRINVPGSQNQQAQDLSVTAMDAVVNAFSDIFPASPTSEQSVDHDYFLGLNGASERWYDYTGGFVRASAGVANDGGVIVGVVFGPTDYWNGDEPFRLIDSMTIVDSTDVF